jgi:hypothetical protein
MCYQQRNFRRNGWVMKDTLPMRPIHLFLPTSALLAPGWPKGHTLEPLPTSPQEVQILSKSVCNEGHFTLDHERVFRIGPRIAARWPKVTPGTSYRCATRSEEYNFGQNLYATKVTLLVMRKVLRPYLISGCSGVVETSHLALYSWDGKFFVSISPPRLSVVTETSQVLLPRRALEAVQVWSKSVGKEGHFIGEA